MSYDDEWDSFNKSISNGCQRCHKAAFTLIMSMFNHQMICDDCKDEERKRPDYKQAEAKDLNEYAGRLDALDMGPQADNVRKLAKSLVEETDGT